MKVPFASVLESPRAKAQREFMEHAAGVHEVQRARRRSDLHSRIGAIEAAVKSYETLDAAGAVPTIRLRSSFVRLSRPRPGLAEVEDQPIDLVERLHRDWRSRPPCTQLIRRASNGLALYLTAVYLAHLDAAPGAHPKNEHANVVGGASTPAWATLAGIGFGLQRARRARINRALRVLCDARLVDLPGTDKAPAFERWAMLREDGLESQYTVPGATAAATIQIPAAFFYNGWHLVLEPKETAILLAVMEQTRRLVSPQDGLGIALPQSVRWERYGITPEVYVSVHELQEFGIIAIHDTMPERRRGRLRRDAPGFNGGGLLEPKPYRFTVDERAFDRPARQTVTKSLSSYPRPPRFTG
jgi:hypothetical protein